jgi:hypothetical protein
MLSVNLAPMTHGKDEDGEFAVFDVTDQAMVAHPIAPQAAKWTCK